MYIYIYTYIISISMCVYIYTYWLVVSTPLNNMKVSWDDYSQLNGKIQVMFQSPPSSIYVYIYIYTHLSAIFTYYSN